MRLPMLVVGSLLVLSTLHLAPAAEARSVLCTELKSPTCPGLVCVDSDLDGYLTYDDACVTRACSSWGCCGPITPCPPPQDELP